jgi:orotate phosphoribosyltransferase
VARALGVRSIFAERGRDGAFVLRRGFHIGPQDRVLLAEDVVTTGKSVMETVPLVAEAGASVAGFCAVADRSLFTADFLTPDASPNVARFRKDPRFQMLVRDTGLLDYWRAVGWPDLCRPLGDGVECD